MLTFFRFVSRWRGSLQSGELDNALKAYKDAIKIYEDIGDKNGISMCLNNLGATHLFGGNAKEAIECLESALEVQREFLGVEGELETLAYLSAAVLQCGRASDALSHSDKALQILREKRFCEEDIQLVYFYRHQILEALGRMGEALDALRIAYEDVVCQANFIKDDEMKHSFIEKFPVRRAIVSAWKERQSEQN